MESQACRWCHEVQTGELVGVGGESVPGRTVRPVLGFRGLLPGGRGGPARAGDCCQGPGQGPEFVDQKPRWNEVCDAEAKTSQRSLGECSSFQGEERARTALP